MGKRKKQKRTKNASSDDGPSNRSMFDISDASSGLNSVFSKANDELFLKSLADNFTQMLEIVKDNKKVLESIDGRLKALECCISTVESGHTNLSTKVNRVEAEVTGVKSEIDELKKHLCVVSEEARFFRDSTSNLSNRLMSLEYRSNDSNLIVWNVPCESQNEAKVIFENICEDGLQMSEVPEFSIVIVEKEKIFFKVNVRSTDAKVDILKRGKRLKGKLVANHINIHLSDDAPISIRVARKVICNER